MSVTWTPLNTTPSDPSQKPRRRGPIDPNQENHMVSDVAAVSGHLLKPSLNVPPLPTDIGRPTATLQPPRHCHGSHVVNPPTSAQHFSFQPCTLEPSNAFSAEKAAHTHQSPFIPFHEPPQRATFSHKPPPPPRSSSLQRCRGQPLKRRCGSCSHALGRCMRSTCSVPTREQPHPR